MHNFQEGAGYTFNSAGGAYCDGIARPFEVKIWVAVICLEMREINPVLSVRALTHAATYFATKVVREIKCGALINPCLQERYCARGAGTFNHIVRRRFVAFCSTG